jgi:hypothetical protein
MRIRDIEFVIFEIGLNLFYFLVLVGRIFVEKENLLLHLSFIL